MKSVKTVAMPLMVALVLIAGLSACEKEGPLERAGEKVDRSLERAGDGRAVISTPDCPLRPLVRDHPASAKIDRAMWAALVEAALDGMAAAVRCETHGCRGAGACTVTVSFDAPS